jgi:hypothetical protein
MRPEGQTNPLRRGFPNPPALRVRFDGIVPLTTRGGRNLQNYETAY